jgi:putative tricarboxylic transport membrane protein
MRANRVAWAGLIAGLAAAAPDLGAQPAWRPERNVEIVVPTAPGGGNDKTARTIQKIWQEQGRQAAVANRTGGGGAVAYTFLNQHAGDGHFMSIAQAGLFTNHITGASPINYTDFSVIANLGIEPSAIAVRVESPIKSAQELFERLRNDPGSLSISIGSTPGGTSHMALARAYKVLGGDPRRLKTVSFKGSAESVVAVMGGHVDVMIAAINNVVPHVQGGKMRALAVTSSQRLGGEFAKVPTLRELGMDVTVNGWTIVMGPRGLNAAQVRYWEDALAGAVQHPEWKAYIDFNYWSPLFQRSPDAMAYLAREYEAARSVLTDLGLAKAQ